MRILGIETSCDDTGIALLEVIERKPPQFRMLANVVSSQIKVHQQYGGVYPMLAKREHEKNLPLVLKKIPQENIDAIAVTYGPGLSPCLWTGLNFAKNLAKKWGIPLIPIDHIEAHFLVGLLGQTDKNDNFSIIEEQIFPAVALIVSGGHTQLILAKNIGRYQIIGETRDDAAGECFDKTARILGLGYPGGPAIAEQTRLWNEEMLRGDGAIRVARAGDLAWSAEGGKSPSGQTARRAGGGTSRYSEALSPSKWNITLPRPMMHTKNYDFSFSGLKTAVLYDYRARARKERESSAYIREMAHEIQQAIVDVLARKTMQAAKEFKAKSIILGGGVAANESLRTHLKEAARSARIKLLAPPPSLATDNGFMIAVAGYFKYKEGAYAKNLDSLEAAPNLRIA